MARRRAGSLRGTRRTAPPDSARIDAQGRSTIFRSDNNEFFKHHGPAICALVWLVIGIVFLMSALQGQTIPTRETLRQATGIIETLRETNRYVRHGPNIDTLYLRLRGADTEYLIDSGRLNGPEPYYRARRGLQRGGEVTLWYEAHPDFGNRLWQIDQQGRRLLHYRETFDHETGQQMHLYLSLLGYLVVSLIVIPLLVAWQRRIAQNMARKTAAIESHT